MKRLTPLALIALAVLWLPASAQAPPVPAEIQEALKRLRDPDPKVRAKAARVLADQGKDAVPVIDELIAAFADPKLDVRASLAGAFAQMGPKATKAVPVLLTALKDEDPHVRRCVVHALGFIKSEAMTVVPALIEMLKDPDKGTEKSTSAPKAAAFALGNFGIDAKPAVPVLLKILNNPEIEWRFIVISPLSKIGDPEAVPHLVKYLDEKTDIYLRGKVIGALAEFGPKAKDSIPHIIGILRTKGDDERTRSARQRAAGALGKMGPAATPEAVKALIEVMKDEKLSMRGQDGQLREIAARSLVELGPKVAKDAIPAMIGVLTNKGNTFARESLIALGKDGVPHLIPYAARFRGEKENDLGVRIQVMKIFEKLGPAAEDAISVLTGVVAENDRQISPLARRALESVSSQREMK